MITNTNKQPKNTISLAPF